MNLCFFFSVLKEKKESGISASLIAVRTDLLAEIFTGGWFVYSNGLHAGRGWIISRSSSRRQVAAKVFSIFHRPRRGNGRV
jgi:hypothetical protein